MNNREQDFQKIYTAYQPKIRRYLARLVNEDEADDLTQEVFIKVDQALENFRGESKVSTWIYRIATNAAMDRLRSSAFQKRRNESSLETVVEKDAEKATRMEERPPSVEQELYRKEMGDCIRSFIEGLSESYRPVLVLIEFEELNNKEVAEILGISLETVKIRIHRARKKLKEMLMSGCDSYWVEGNEFLPDLKEILKDS